MQVDQPAKSFVTARLASGISDSLWTAHECLARGTETVVETSMRFYTARARTFVMLLALSTLGALAGCGAAASPTIAGLGGGNTTKGSSLAISPNQVQLLVHATAQLTTNAPANLQSQVQWSSQPTTIASISPSGLVTALAPGTATVTARYASDTTNVATATVVVTSISGS